MTTLVDAELHDLKINLDDTEIRNDLRVLIPHYDYVITYVGEDVDTITYNDLILASIDSDSIQKYGRRSRINRYQIMDQTFQEAWAENQKQRYAEPFYNLEAVIPGTDDNIAKCLNTKISDQLTVTETTSGINNEYMVDSYTLEVRPNFLSVKLGLRELNAIQQLDYFNIDVDLIDGEAVIG